MSFGGLIVLEQVGYDEVFKSEQFAGVRHSLPVRYHASICQH